MVDTTKWVGHFWKREEFACHDGCGRADVHPVVVELADAVRRHLGVAMQCNSGVRCEDRNRACGGKSNSLHLPAGALHQGHAADFTFAQKHLRNRVNILRLYVLFESYSRKYGAVGLGLYGSGFVHVDFRGALGMKPARWEQNFKWPRL